MLTRPGLAVREYRPVVALLHVVDHRSRRVLVNAALRRGLVEDVVEVEVVLLPVAVRVGYKVGGVRLSRL